MEIRERIEGLRNEMKKHGIHVYIIPSADFHQSEYVGDYFKSREFMSGFNGSAGSLVVTLNKAGLWTDGRYYLQAENQLKDTGIELFKDGLEDTKKLKDYVYDELPEGGKLGFDGRVLSAKEGKSYQEAIAKKNATIVSEYDLVDAVWTTRPALSKEKAFKLSLKSTGEDFATRLQRVRDKMKEAEAQVHILSMLDDIAWLYNIRGNDVAYNPVVQAYTIIGEDWVRLFVDEEKLNDEIMGDLKSQNVKILPYNDLYEYLKNKETDWTILLDEDRVNYAILQSLPEKANKKFQVNPTLFMKAVKNEVELENNRNAHIKDGVAVTKFMYWLKENGGKLPITELDAEEKMEAFRKEQPDYFQPSFHTISAFGANAAMMHYAASDKSNASIEKGALYLIDSGGQYYDGTTDITRTYAIGQISDALKRDFTLVLKGMINLSMTKFLYGCRGFNLDILARGPMWKYGIDYRSGTGHGIGYILNVHESPNGFRWRVVPERFDSEVLEAGMITTNEPGIYEDGSHGIRLENELVTRKAELNQYGQFMDFEVITFTPLDLDAVLPEMLNHEEKEYLNWYHQQVFEKISPYLNDEEKTWLKKYTRAI